MNRALGYQSYDQLRAESLSKATLTRSGAGYFKELLCEPSYLEAALVYGREGLGIDPEMLTLSERLGIVLDGLRLTCADEFTRMRQRDARREQILASDHIGADLAVGSIAVDIACRAALNLSKACVKHFSNVSRNTYHLSESRVFEELNGIRAVLAQWYNFIEGGRGSLRRRTEEIAVEGTGDDYLVRGLEYSRIVEATGVEVFGWGENDGTSTNSVLNNIAQVMRLEGPMWREGMMKDEFAAKVL